MHARPEDPAAPRRPRVGFHVSAFGSGQILAAFSALSAAGFDGLEIYEDTTLIYADRPEELREIATIAGVAIAGVHGGGTLTSEEYRNAEAAEWTRLLAWTARAGADYAVYCGGDSHGDPESDLRRAAAFLNDMGAVAEGYGVRLCYEPDRHSPFATTARIGALLARTDPDLVWISADTARLAQMGLDPAAYIAAHHRRVAVVHVRDLTDPRDPASADRPYIEPGRGTLDLRAVADALRSVEYRRWVVGVVDRPARSAHDSASRTARFFREDLGW